MPIIVIKNNCNYLDRLIFFVVLKNYFDETIKSNSVSFNILVKKTQPTLGDSICGHNYLEAYTQKTATNICESTS